MSKTLLILTLCLGMAIPGLALAHDVEGEGPNMGAISFSAGVDLTTQYNFRGMNREDQGAIVQPWFEITSQLYSGDALAPIIEGVALKLGMWNTIHDSSPATQGHGSYYEADYYAGVVLDLPQNLTGEILYMYREDPDAVGNYAEEVNFRLDYDDAGWWEGAVPLAGFHGLQPHVLIALETDGAMDLLGNGGDVYYEIGIEPSMLLLDSADWPVTLSVPMTFGFGDDYYEHDTTGNGIADSDESFGFFDIGLVCEVPLNFVPPEHGKWKAHVGVHFLFVGDGAEALTTNTSMDDSEVIGSMGVEMTY